MSYLRILLIFFTQYDIIWSGESSILMLDLQLSNTFASLTTIKPLKTYISCFFIIAVFYQILLAQNSCPLNTVLLLCHNLLYHLKMDDQIFESIDEQTEQLVRRQALQTQLQEATLHCQELTKQLTTQKSHQSQISAISDHLNQKLKQITQIIDNLQLIKIQITKQTDSFKSTQDLTRENNQNISVSIQRLSQIVAQMQNQNKLMVEEWVKLSENKQKQASCYYQNIIKSKDEQISTLKLALDKLTENKTEESKAFDFLMGKLSSLELNIQGLRSQESSLFSIRSQLTKVQKVCVQQQKSIQVLKQQLAKEKQMSRLSKANYPKLQNNLRSQNNKTSQDFNKNNYSNPFLNIKRQFEKPKQYTNNTNIFNTCMDKYPNSISAESQSQNVCLEIQKLLITSTQSVVGIMSKCSNELLSQLSQKDSMRKMHSEYQRQISIQEIKLKLTNIDASGKKAVEQLLNQTKTTLKRLLGSVPIKN